MLTNLEKSTKKRFIYNTVGKEEESKEEKCNVSVAVREQFLFELFYWTTQNCCMKYRWAFFHISGIQYKKIIGKKLFKITLGGKLAWTLNGFMILELMAHTWQSFLSCLKFALIWHYFAHLPLKGCKKCMF